MNAIPAAHADALKIKRKSAMELNRISVKMFVNNPTAVDLPAFIPLFHQWIQNKTVPGLLIDVADYRHVPEGPGVLLVGHDVEYGMDYSGGRPGLVAQRKRRSAGSIEDRLREVLGLAVRAAAAIEAASVTGATFDTSQMKITLIDRLHAPNTAATVDQLRGPVQQVLSELYGSSVTLSVADADPRVCFNLTARAASPVTLTQLLGRLDSAGASFAAAR
jgi:hypothetical protein